MFLEAPTHTHTHTHSSDSSAPVTEGLFSSVQDQTEPMTGMSLMAGKALSSARMSDILSQTSLTGSQQLRQREDSGQFGRSGQGNLFKKPLIHARSI